MVPAGVGCGPDAAAALEVAPELTAVVVGSTVDGRGVGGRVTTAVLGVGPTDGLACSDELGPFGAPAQAATVRRSSAVRTTIEFSRMTPPLAMLLVT